MESASRSLSITVDQRKAWKGDGGVLLGTFAFDAADGGWVDVRNDGSDGHVIADAVQFVFDPRPKN
jgi:hypothetical protein